MATTYRRGLSDGEVIIIMILIFAILGVPFAVLKLKADLHGNFSIKDRVEMRVRGLESRISALESQIYTNLPASKVAPK